MDETIKQQSREIDEPINEESSEWDPTPESLMRLLKWLDGGTDSDGQNYKEMHCMLVSYFERKDCLSPEKLADETFNRVMKWLEQNQKEYDEEPAKICYTTARYVFYEDLRRHQRDSALANNLLPLAEEQEEKEKRLNCLERCSKRLPVDDLNLIVDYYDGEKAIKIENRKQLAARRKLSLNALRIRASRIRDGLRHCVEECLSE